MSSSDTYTSGESSHSRDNASDNLADIKKCLEDAEELKTEATEYFRSNEWSQALATYRSALLRLPSRGQQSTDTSTSANPDANNKSRDEIAENDDLSEDSQRCAKLRSILNANIGACYVKLDDHKEAVKACTEALLDDPCYIKALQRRAASNEKIGSWSSLSSARDDYNTLIQLLPPGSKDAEQVKRAIRFLEPRIEDTQKRETGEMFDKLKGIGNSILGNFGLSTDNFKFVPNGQGGYSVNFEH